MKKKVYALMLALALLALPALSQAHSYDRDDSDYPLRYVAYALNPIGIAVEYGVLRPIHWIVSRPVADVIFGHEPREGDEYFVWE